LDFCFPETKIYKFTEKRKMANYTYETATGSITIEIDEEWATRLTDADTDEANANRRHTRPDHKYAPGEPVSLDSLEYDGEWFTDRGDGIEAIELSVDMERALATLTGLQRRYVTLAVLRGHSYAELARKDNISEAAIRKHIKLAMPKLKKYFS
jgi:RNA polymerase sigma factor (sigma-70 family)